MLTVTADEAWLLVATTLLGGALTFAGGFAGAWWAERRADARQAAEREHEREVWARGLRHEAHVAFLSIVDQRYNTIEQARMDPSQPPEPPEDYLVPVWDQYQALRIVCTSATAEAASEVANSLMNYAYGRGRWEQIEYARDTYLGMVRQEFGLPPIPLMGD